MPELARSPMRGDRDLPHGGVLSVQRGPSLYAAAVLRLRPAADHVQPYCLSVFLASIDLEPLTHIRGIGQHAKQRGPR
jgi:hypothetical protein